MASDDTDETRSTATLPPGPTGTIPDDDKAPTENPAAVPGVPAEVTQTSPEERRFTPTPAERNSSIPLEPGEKDEHDDSPTGAMSLLQKVQNSRPVRAFLRLGKARGSLLAGGIAYTALFSIVSALTIAWTVFSLTLGANEALRRQVILAVNSTLPNILKTSPEDPTGMIDPNSLVMTTALNPASILATLILVWSAIGLMSNIRSTVQAMFGIIAPAENFALAKLRDLVGFIAMAIGIVASSLLGTAASTLGGTVMGWLGVGDNPVLAVVLRILGLVVAAAVATLTFAFLFRFTAAVRALPADLWLGSLVGGVAVQIVLFASTALVAKASSNPLLAASASVGVLLIMVNLLSQVLMFAAAFTANPPAPDVPKSPKEVHFKETPNFVTLSAPRTLEWKHQDVTGQIDVDETLRPGYKKPKGSDRRPTDFDTRPDGQPIGHALVGPLAAMRLRRKARRYEQAVVDMRARLGQRPRIGAAEEEYWLERGIKESRLGRRH